VYAVIRAGGKQFKVSQGDVIEIEKLGQSSGTVEFSPLLVVDDGGEARVSSSDLGGASVTAEVLGEVKGPKVEVVKYRPKTGYRRHRGHRQRYTSVRISQIRLGKEPSSTRKRSEGATNGS
jgi:large subunit ribosomal protein L21